MTTKLIKHEGYWMLVSDKEITLFDTLKDNCYYLWNDRIIKREYSHHSDGKLILFSQNPEHNLPTIKFSDEVAKELGIVDVEKLAGDKIFTLEDMINLVAYVANFEDDNDCNIASSGRMPSEIAKTFIQSLTKKEYFCELEMVDNGYEVDMEGVGGMDLGDTCWFVKLEPKITNNSCKVIKIWN